MGKTLIGTISNNGKQKLTQQHTRINTRNRINRQEVEIAIKTLKIEITNEFLKYGEESIKQEMTSLIQKRLIQCLGKVA